MYLRPQYAHNDVIAIVMYLHAYGIFPNPCAQVTERHYLSIHVLGGIENPGNSYMYIIVNYSVNYV